ncbi:MAG: hypothetical protein Q8L30_02410 [bacterium]|nr:hypothetical protein [bacterium]
MEITMSALSLLWISLFLTIGFAISMAALSGKYTGLGVISGVIALLALIFTSAVMYDLGRGNVPNLKASVLSERLEVGVAYQLLASSEDEAGEQVVLLKKTGTSDFYALRVKEVPPKNFTLIGGNPVAIVLPVPVVGKVAPPK